MSAVKLRDFFEMQSNTGMDAHRKAQIFSKIQRQTQTVRQATPFSLVRNSWYFKTTATAALAFVLMYILYTPLSGPLFQSDNLLIARNTSNIVQAGYVWDMVATQGQIMIVRNGITTTTSQLQWWDIVYLYNTSKADFVLRDGSRGSVEWPAQLTIVEHEDSGLVLTVDHARYMQIDKSDKNIRNDQDKPTNEDLVIETSTSRITTKKDDTVHLALVTTQDRQFIQNKGDDLTIESIVPTTASPVTKQLASSHVADVTDALKVYTQVAAIYDELKSQSISQTYDISNEEALEIDDMRRLLAFDITQYNAPSRTTNVIVFTTPVPSTIVTRETSQQSSDIAPIYEDISESDDTPTQILALTTMSDEPVDNSSTTRLTSKDAEIVVDVLWEALEENNEAQAVAVTATSTKPITQIPLTNSQLSIITTLRPRSCISNIQLQQLQTWFDIDSKFTLKETVANITSTYYLTAKLTSTLTSLTSCDDN